MTSSRPCVHYDFRGTSRRSGAGVLLIRRGMLLLARRGANESNPLTWATFGGKAERGETDEACAIREVYEEAEIKVAETDLAFIHERVESHGFRYVTFLAFVDDDAVVRPWKETHAVGEFPFGDGPGDLWRNLPDDLHPGLAATIRCRDASRVVMETLSLGRVREIRHVPASHASSPAHA